MKIKFYFLIKMTEEPEILIFKPAKKIPQLIPAVLLSQHFDLPQSIEDGPEAFNIIVDYLEDREIEFEFQKFSFTFKCKILSGTSIANCYIRIYRYNSKTTEANPNKKFLVEFQRIDGDRKTFLNFFHDIRNFFEEKDDEEELFDVEDVISSQFKETILMIIKDEKSSLKQKMKAVKMCAKFFTGKREITDPLDIEIFYNLIILSEQDPNFEYLKTFIRKIRIAANI
jgi:hypothetical protein